jgi:hypothetical protein
MFEAGMSFRAFRSYASRRAAISEDAHVQGGAGVQDVDFAAKFSRRGGGSASGVRRCRGRERLPG